ncbi:MAG: YihY/virulence factor BrkB family protein [Oscillatoriales cyanobacterium C42_A2020_001]|nr:YihY/virulence factor BrkB family protein [Leptolyngbyaceae cyanobacterium C42_A2020_001]
MKILSIWKLLKETFSEWQADKVPVWAAALAYYTAFSLAPLLVIAIAIASAVFGEEAARGEVVGQIQGLVGKPGAEAIQAMLQNTQKPGSGGIVATAVGIGALLLGASGVFGQLQEALNAIWGVQPKPGRGMRFFIQNRFVSFAMVLVIGFLLLVSLLLSAGLAAFGAFLGYLFPDLAIAGQILNFLISFGVMVLLFGLIYKVLPDVKIPWKYLWIGAIVTALLFNIGKFLIGLYLGSGSVSSTYSAAASLGIILLWVFYSAQILLFGAEFTKVYARKHGMHRIKPVEDAVLVEK